MPTEHPLELLVSCWHAAASSRGSPSGVSRMWARVRLSAPVRGAPPRPRPDLDPLRLPHRRRVLPLRHGLRRALTYRRGLADRVAGMDVRSGSAARQKVEPLLIGMGNKAMHARVSGSTRSLDSQVGSASPPGGGEWWRCPSKSDLFDQAMWTHRAGASVLCPVGSARWSLEALCCLPSPAAPCLPGMMPGLCQPCSQG